ILRYPATTLSAYLHDPPTFTPTAEEAGEEPTPARTPYEDDDDAAAFGTAGHEMLEQLALSGWPGEATALLTALGAARTLDESARGDLLRRVGRAARHLAAETRGAEVATEWPFALKLEHNSVVVIVDGTMDLLITRGGRRRVVDYKFTEEAPERLAARYGLQLNLYREAMARRDSIPAESIAASILAIRREGIDVVEIPPEPGCAARAVEAAQGLYKLRGQE
ncbi:MAG: PD-(D/E)XK nuclease family protein, partial [Verrucomicrobia bacterium]|nr:PD-(D/E)XK nuclease family protein [Verrucomicrobiota bacterium]